MTKSTITFVQAMNEQIGHEFAASQQYVAVAVWYEREVLPQLASFFYRQALEERMHALMLTQYLIDAEAEVTVPGVAAPLTNFADPIAPIALALDQEKKVTAQIQRLAMLARGEGDLVGEQFMGWFLKEQLEEMSSMSALLRTVERASATNILLAEDAVARINAAVGASEGDAGAPPAAGA